MNPKADQLRSEILSLVAEYHKAAFAERAFVPGESSVPYAGRVFDGREIRNLVDASLDFWLTTGRFAQRFEREFARWMGVRQCLLVNSGSSANLVALSALTSPRLGDRRLRPGDEVITVAAGFPTTVNPILQNGLVPVFVDVTLPTYNVDTSQLEAALSPRTRALILAHTLGNPFDVGAVASFARKHDLWLVEDCCDALGSTYLGRKTGTFGDLATVSFYPAHHMTMGEGGAVLTNTPILHTIAESFRDWGRDCWCEPGCDNTCGKRFDWQLGGLPCGYDHKFIYSHIGYNLKLTDMQAAVGVAQLEKLDGFVAARRRNFRALREGLAGLEEFFVLPEATTGAEPSWFGFPIAVRAGAPFSRNQATRYLEDRKIATRLLFGGNLVRQPAYRESQYRVIGSLSQTDYVMNQVFWIGLYPGIGPVALDYMVETLRGAACLTAPVGA
ncbi:MAG: lipopolysaccharide biosynthesis protein RfbH [Bryobacteraceae bacterium]|jgi:CDP-6-deoxy-D-xylo-4-hexulose-3-dehydrase